MNRKQTIIALASLALVVVCLFLFLKKDPVPETPVERRVSAKSLKIGVIPTTECLPFLVADRLGLADSMGLDLHVELFHSCMDADTAFLRHRIDGITTDMVKLGIWGSHGEPVVGVMGGTWHLAALTTRQSRISSPSNLKEKIVAITRNSCLDMYADLMMGKANLESVDLNKPQINDLRIRYRMVEQNELDGAILPPPWSEMCLRKGCRLISDYSELDGMSNNFALVFNDSLLSRRKADVKKLIKVYNSSVDYIKRHKIFKSQYFFSLLGIDTYTPPQFLCTERLTHAVPLSEESLEAGLAWSRSRDLVGKERTDSLLSTEYLTSK